MNFNVLVQPFFLCFFVLCNGDYYNDFYSCENVLLLLFNISWYIPLKFYSKFYCSETIKNNIVHFLNCCLRNRVQLERKNRKKNCFHYKCLFVLRIKKIIICLFVSQPFLILNCAFRKNFLTIVHWVFSMAF